MCVNYKVKLYKLAGHAISKLVKSGAKMRKNCRLDFITDHEVITYNESISWVLDVSGHAQLINGN